MTYRVLTAEPAHETNTFSCRPTNAQAFKDQYLLIGQQAIAARGQAGTELAGFLDAAKDHGWELDHVLSAAAALALRPMSPKILIPKMGPW